ncbi:MAG: DUF5009 domain-containing protein [Planctomycetia bacterium]|nr:DUF5009 domain-containing protein [Planctomycetia bacterium]
MENNVSPKKERVLSLDVLRGFDLFVLLCVGPLFLSLAAGPFKDFFQTNAWGKAIEAQFHHVRWEGFVAWDLIMPLFLFMVGAAIPFSLSKYTSGSEEKPTFRLYFRIIRRFLLLWILGMIAQGHLLDLKIQGLNFYSNTLQAIAAGYLISSILYLIFRIKGQILITILLLAAYWALMTFVKFGDFGGGSFLPESNLSEGIDQKVLGCWRAGVVFQKDGSWAFSTTSHYTWILSSLTFAATVMTGLFAGELIRTGIAKNTEGEADEKKKKSVRVRIFGLLLLIGVLLTAAGFGWSKIPEGSPGYCPLIKTIWTPSMVLFSSGLSFILLALFYAFYDLFGFRCGSTLFKVIGMNAIAAYMLPRFFNFSTIAKMPLHGLEQYMGVWYTPLITFSGFMLVWFILWGLYRSGRFLRV